MQNITLQDVTAAVAKNRRKSIWKRIVSVLACIVVFCTTYALILPALTLERDPDCGIEEHTHTEACYVRVDTPAEQVLVCNAETLGLHIHTDGCIGLDGGYICGYSDFVVHSHNEFCFDENGLLVCTLPEIFPHTHTDGCYLMSDLDSVLSGELDGFDNPFDGSLDNGFDNGLNNGIDAGLDGVAGHIHTDDCYITERGELICTLPEATAPAHIHTDECYLNTNELTCPLIEGEGHIHGEGCFDESGALLCAIPESAGHVHTPECYQSSSALICTIAAVDGEQAHVHTDDCYAQNRVLVCEIPEEPSFVGDDTALPIPQSEPADGFAQTGGAEGLPADAYPENNIPENDIFDGSIIDNTAETDDRGEPVCGMTEIILHCHGDSCFDENGTIICGMTEVLEHIHTQDCMGESDNPDNLTNLSNSDNPDNPDELTCTIAEGEGAHIHTAEGGCFDADGNLICEMTESEGHVHSAICYGNWILVCGIEEHTHTEECYPSDEPEPDPESRVVICGMEEHAHTDECIDENGVIICGIEEHTHAEECYLDTSVEREAFCGKVEHTHGEECIDSNGVISCGIEEHTHGEECYVKKPIEEILGFMPLAIANTVENDGMETYGIMLMSVAGDSSPVDFKNQINGVTLYYKKGNDWIEYNNDHLFKKGDAVKFNIKYRLEGGTLHDGNRTITYQLPEKLELNQALGGVVYNDAGNQVGNYNVSTAGVVTIVFNETFYENNSNKNQAINGKFDVEAELGKNAAENDSIKIEFNSGVKVDIPLDTDETSLTLTKDAGTVNPTTGKVEYTITLSAGSYGSSNPVTLEDLMNGIILDGDISVICSDGNTCTTSKTDNGFTIQFANKMGPNATYTVKYSAKLPEGFDSSTTDITADNTVKAKTTKISGEPIEETKTAKVTYSQNYLSKSGSLSGDKSVIYWTVKINEGKQDIGEWTMNDFLNGAQLDKFLIVLQPSEGDPITITSLPYQFNPGEKRSFTIQYSTPADLPLYENSVKNKVVLEDPQKHKIEAEHNVPIIEDWNHYNPLSKSAMSYDKNPDGTININYRVTINADKGEIPKGWVYTDNLGANQYFTEQQRTAIETELNSKLSGYGYTLQWTHSGTNYTGFIITFGEALPKGSLISFNYTAIGIIANAESEQEFKNIGDINKKVTSEGKIKYYPLLQKYDPSKPGQETTEDTYKNKNGILKWKVVVAPPDGYSGGPLTIKEILPEGIELQKLDFKPSDNSPQSILNDNTYTYTWWDGHDNHSFSINKSTVDNVVTITVPQEMILYQGSRRFELEIEAKIKDDVEYSETSNSKPAHSFINKVEVSYGDVTESKQQTQIITNEIVEKEVLKKTEGEMKDNIVPYSIVINPDGKDLVADSDTLTVVDTATKYSDVKWDLRLVPGEVVVYNLNPDGSKGTRLDVTEYPYTYTTKNVKLDRDAEQHILTLELPDQRPLLLEYKYKTSGDTAKWMYYTNSVEISNAIEIPSSSTETGFNIVDSSASAETSGISVLKHDMRSMGIVLPDVVFELQGWDATEGKFVSIENRDSADGKFSTDATGMFSIPMLKYNKAYRLIEISPPSGYLKPSEPYQFYIPHTDEELHIPCMPDNFQGTQLSAGQILYLPNEKSTTDITVTKKWLEKDTNKDITSTRQGDIHFELRRYILDEEPGSKPNTANLHWNINLSGTEHNLSETPIIGSTIKLTVTAPWENHINSWETIEKPPILTINGNKFTMNHVAEKLFEWTYIVTADTEITTEFPERSNLFAGGIPTIEITPPDPIQHESEPVSGYSDVVISAANNWRTTIRDLPKTGEDTDPVTGEKKTVYYTYYVVESTSGIPDLVGEPAYTNNPGITTGTITITNTVDTDPKHELPQTGGKGTSPITALGGGVIAITLALALIKRLQDKKVRESG